MLYYVFLWLLAVLMTAAGVMHFLATETYLKIMPPYLPWPEELVYISGVFEILLGITLLIPRTRRIAARGLIALFIAVFPANLHMALHPELFPSLGPVFSHIEPWMLYARLPLQLPLIWWAYWMSLPRNGDS